jgi:hypothetical protein
MFSTSSSEKLPRTLIDTGDDPDTGQRGDEERGRDKVEGAVAAN